MKRMNKMGYLFAGLICWQTALAQDGTATANIVFNDLSDFKNAGTNWTIASDAACNFNQPNDIQAIAGKGCVVDKPDAKNNSHLITQQEFGDAEVELDFMMAKGSNSGIYLQGRYEVQLFDSWQKIHPTYSDCGGVYQRWDDNKPGDEKGYEGTAPLVNVTRAPGLWQHIKIRFRAPKFGADGKKISNAVFEEVYLNGTLVQEETAVTGPTRSSAFNDEKAIGPLMLQGDHGPVAFRNIQIRPLQSGTAAAPVKKRRSMDNPIVFNPSSNEPVLLRSFWQYGDTKLTHVISAGYPDQTNFAYNLKEGALLQIWRGPFLDVTDMWHERGEPQLAKPLGSAISFPNQPPVAVLSSNTAAWPDSVAFDDFNNKGYSLDKERNPTFKYNYNGINVMDKIFSANGAGLTREIKVDNPPAQLYCKIATADNIQQLSKGLYAVSNKSYYVQIDEKYAPVIRQTAKGQEMLVPVSAQNNTVSYSITW